MVFSSLFQCLTDLGTTVFKNIFQCLFKVSKELLDKGVKFVNNKKVNKNNRNFFALNQIEWFMEFIKLYQGTPRMHYFTDTTAS